MATIINLKATPRDDTGKGVARKLRAAGRLPAVVYGVGSETQILSLDAHETKLAFPTITAVRESVVHLHIEGASAPVATVVRELQAHPYRPEILHIDFLRVAAGSEG
jgi:large subunit ribosomal protein L25